MSQVVKNSGGGELQAKGLGSYVPYSYLLFSICLRSQRYAVGCIRYFLARVGKSL